ncbi:acylamino-acid-releasing enzyme [Stegostoma tigrinum]|uniref:acylamino-acid-releasing enzyme n=1 Tax=Stegostoma tigrinum TaxID=3053191 RepID=UPI00202B413C|nr:acylamino-acid-releasing enzyme [Stegostoma tigrinum]
MASEVITNPNEIAEIYKELSKFPSLSKACIGPEVISQYGGKHCNIYTEWSQRDLERAEKVKFCRQYIMFYDEDSIVYTGPSGNCTELQGELLSKESPSGFLKAVLREHTNKKGEEKQFLEIWNKNSKEKSINLTALDKHGKVYEDDHFGCLVWSHSETHILYVAEKKKPKAESFFQAKPELGVNEEEDDSIKPEKQEKPVKGDEFVYWEDWGETLVKKTTPVLCVLDIESNNISVLEGIPEHISPGQAFWAPNDTGIIFVGWYHEPQRLGLVYCTNRKSGLYYVDLTGGNCVQLTSQTNAVWSPRLSPDKCRIIYLESDAGGPHHQCSRLRMYDWYTKVTSTVVDIVTRPNENGFTGIYSSALAQSCWAMDSQRVIIDTCQRSRKDLLVINIANGSVLSLTSGSSSVAGSWTLLAIHQDLMVVTCSSPNCPPSLKVGFLPAPGKEQGIIWVALDEAEPLPDIEWNILNFTPPCEQKNPKFSVMDFEGILLIPGEKKEGASHPLIVWPHGGPHSVFIAEWLLYPVTLCRLGFFVLLVNYRGSAGFGQDFIYSLPGNVGSQDVKDVQFSAEQVLKERFLDTSKVFVIGGSHGGFLASHLVGQYPEFYKAGVIRNPVTNIVSMLGTTDIPDWCMVEAGFEYTAGQLPTPALLEAMLIKSPIIHASQVKSPMLIMLGEKDKRVPPTQGLEFYRALKSRGVSVRLLWYPDNNHSLSKVDAEADGFMNIALWFVKHL